LKKLRTLAGRQVRDLSRQLIKLGKLEPYAPMLAIMARIVSQQHYQCTNDGLGCVQAGESIDTIERESVGAYSFKSNFYAWPRPQLSFFFVGLSK
jgi:hypothetical protein